MGLSWQEFWSGLPFPSLGDLPDAGIEPASLMSPVLVCSLPLVPPGKPGGSFSTCKTTQGCILGDLSMALEDELKVLDFVLWLNHF